MAVFYANTAFNANTLDVHAPFGGSPTVTAGGTMDFVFDGLSLSLGGNAVTILGLTLTVEGQVMAAWGAGKCLASVGAGADVYCRRQDHRRHGFRVGVLGERCLGFRVGGVLAICRGLW